MKKTYNKPFADVIKIDTADIMSTSLTISYNLDGTEDNNSFANLFSNFN